MILSFFCSMPVFQSLLPFSWKCPTVLNYSENTLHYPTFKTQHENHIWEKQTDANAKGKVSLTLVLTLSHLFPRFGDSSLVLVHI